ncbi:MAG: hypothetical protein WDN28_24375 [Chthoniobacter sp.]
MLAGEHHRLLEEHADLFPQGIHIGARRVNGPAVQLHVAPHAESGNQVGEPVQRPQQGALARAGGTDEAEDLAGADGEMDVANQGAALRPHFQPAGFEDGGDIGRDGRWTAIRHWLLRGV